MYRIAWKYTYQSDSDGDDNARKTFPGSRTTDYSTVTKAIQEARDRSWHRGGPYVYAVYSDDSGTWQRVSEWAADYGTLTITSPSPITGGTPMKATSASLFSYVVLKNGETTDDPATILVGPKTVVAANEEAVKLQAARDLPPDVKTEDVQIRVKSAF